ncbi:2430_t:CDS:2 [Ambispora gerdemannii]|uniref:2430_t:CDS:1 n=1 Tax=Ambispora gerdemannii TaxID=144530 RepID=A0A9N9FGL1_9GLOM|nr:2430_t:CDS:2 [Ambispora gerdemannii]
MFRFCIPGRREKFRNNWIPGLAEIGSGYDYINGKYASSESCTENLFDWSEEPVQEIELHGKTHCYPKGVIECYPERAVNYNVVAGETLEEYQKSLSVTVAVEGGFAGFSASVKTEYGDFANYNKFYCFSRVQYEYNAYLLHLTSNIVQLRKLLKPGIRDEIDDPNCHPAVIFKKYGTHFVHSLRMGGRVVLSASTNKLKYNAKNDLRRMAELAFRSFVSGSGSDDKHEEIKSFAENSEFKMQARGGDVEALGDDFKNMHIAAWAATVLGEPVFVAFDNPYSLTFIGDLACTEKRQNEFAMAWPFFAQSQKMMFPSFDPPYLEYARIRVEYSAGDPPAFYKPILLEGSKWKWLAQTLDYRGFGIVVREKPFAEGLLREVTHAKKFGHEHYGRGGNMWFWNPLTDDPDNFVALGAFVWTVNEGFDKGLAKNKELVGVHKSLCISGELGTPVDSCFLNIAYNNDAINIGAFMPDNSDGRDPIFPIWLLRKDMAELVEYVN